MTKWSLPTLFENLHLEVAHDLARARRSLGHSTTLGDATEDIWIELLQKYLPSRYAVEKAVIIDSKGASSQQIDIVIFDRQYTPPIFLCGRQKVIPAESVYAVFEAKQAVNADLLTYAQTKAASVRKLHRTSAPIHSMGKRARARKLFPIMAGILSLESEWKPAFGAPLKKALKAKSKGGSLDLGCVAADGCFWKASSGYSTKTDTKAVTFFLLKLMSKLQRMGTVPAIDIEKYAAWL